MSGFSEIGDWIAIAVMLVILGVAAWPLGSFMARVYDGKRTAPGRVLQPVENLTYRALGIDPQREMGWKTYATALLMFNLVGFLLVYGLQRLQGILPLNPEGLPGVEPLLSFNTAISFVSNTNWQSYSGEGTLGYLTQMAGLTVQNFVSAATGMAVLVALARGFSRRTSNVVGNFWVDMTRSVLYVLLPLSIVGALTLVALGVPQTLSSYVEVVGVNGEAQRLALGPAASQIIIKQLGTNGGGFFGVNSAHPFENPNIWANTIELTVILLIPVAMVFMFGRMIGNIRQGVAIAAAMTILLVAALGAVTWAERSGNPLIDDQVVSQETLVNGENAPGGNMEGKELRFGIAASTTWTAYTTAASNGSVNAMHDSLTPLGGLVPIVLMATGEVIFGGVGSGMYGMLLYAILAIFVVGLMVGRTPELLQKRIESREIRLAMLALLVSPVLMLSFTALAVALPEGRDAALNAGPHGFSEIFYTFVSGAGNNGSAFAGLGANTPFYNVMLGLAMFLGRFMIIIPVLAIAGALARKPAVAVTRGTFPTTGPLWVGTLVGVVVIIGALTFLPAFGLGPIVEHIFMNDGIRFGAD
jgi:K+-transporting ATPase ATPase A chain